jgi:hypothetical protein
MMIESDEIFLCLTTLDFLTRKRQHCSYTLASLQSNLREFGKGIGTGPI